MSNLTSEEWLTVMSALRVAIEVYERDALHLKRIGFEGLANQFRRQMGDAQVLLANLEDNLE